jgi:tRNA modification GTPase
VGDLLDAALAEVPRVAVPEDEAAPLRIAIVGRPNVGKSSLFNALVGESRAIVAPLPGTTRDRVSESLEIRGVPVMLSDTAGLRAAADPIEALGVTRAEEAIESALVLIWVIDGSQPLADEDRALAPRLAGRPVLVVLNKDDLPQRATPEDVRPLANGAAVVRAAAARGEGMAEVRAALAEMLGAGAADGTEALAVGNPRHVEAIQRAHAALVRAGDAARASAPGEIVALELRDALAAIGEVTGRAVGEDLLERIFSRFCVGK